MFNESKRKSCAIIGAFGVVVLGVACWYFMGRTSHEARAGDADFRDLTDAGDPQPTPQVAMRIPPLATIPWKRGIDSFASATVNPARLPWLREAKAPGALVLVCAALPWNRTVGGDAPASSLASARPAHDGEESLVSAKLEPASLPWDQQRVCSYAPVFLPQGELPWRH